MKKVFITGGTGTIGKAFISTFYDRYKFFSTQEMRNLK